MRSVPTAKKGQQLKIAFKLSNPLEQHTYWPQHAVIEKTLSWGVMEF